MLVTHSHSHGDHTAGDAQFRGKPRVMLIEPEAVAVARTSGSPSGPGRPPSTSAGGSSSCPRRGTRTRVLSFTTRRTGWLLTGDSVYPGMLYIKDWNGYRASIRRLVEFSKAHRISAVMGTHIEMSTTPGKVFPRGSTFQPDEPGLALSARTCSGWITTCSEPGRSPGKSPW